MSDPHLVYYEEDEDGWFIPFCGGCDWRSSPMPDFETAADTAGDHRVAVLLGEERKRVLSLINKALEANEQYALSSERSAVHVALEALERDVREGREP